MFRWDGAAWNEVSYGDVTLLCQGGGEWGILSIGGDDVYGRQDLVHRDGDRGWEPLMLFDAQSVISDVWIGEVSSVGFQTFVEEGGAAHGGLDAGEVGAQRAPLSPRAVEVAVTV